MIALIKYNEEKLFTSVVQECRKGKFIYILCEDKKVMTLMRKFLKTFKIPKKRGIYMWKGIIVLSSYVEKEFIKYFDKVIKVDL